MLTRAIGAAEGLFMQQAGQTLFLGNHPQYFHHQLVAVAVHIGDVKYRSQLMLSRGSFVVFTLGGDAQFPQPAVHFMHEVGDPDADAIRSSGHPVPGPWRAWRRRGCVRTA